MSGVTNQKKKTLTIDVLANDTDPDGNLNPLSVTVVSSPTGPGNKFGTVEVQDVNGRNMLVYTEPDAKGAFSIVYRICDTQSACSQATVPATLT